MTGMYQCRDIVSPGTIYLGSRSPITFVQGHIVSGRPVTPPERLREERWEQHFCSTFPTTDLGQKRGNGAGGTRAAFMLEIKP